MIQRHSLSSQILDDVYENIDDYNPNRKRKNLIVFNDMISDIISDNKFQAVVKELFFRCRELNISQIFISCSKWRQIKFNSLFYCKN